MGMRTVQFRAVGFVMIAVCALVAADLSRAQVTMPEGKRIELPPSRVEPYVPEGLRDVGIDEKPGSQVPSSIRFVDEKGRSVQLGDFFNDKRPIVIQFGYFGCPMLCGQISQGTIESLRPLELTIGKDFELVYISFDPAEDAALAALKKQSYIDAAGAPAGVREWHFLTGTRDNIRAATDATGFQFKWVSDSKQFSHPAALIVLTPDGRISRYLYGQRFDPSTLRLSLVEASDGKIGTTWDRIILTCFAYDGKSGRYSMQALVIMRIAGVATVVGLGAIIGVALYRERRARVQASVVSTGQNFVRES
jgi:protein SCO1/2